VGSNPTPSADVPFVHRHRVRYHECDPQGIVFNGNWFQYFDVTLTELWREALGSYQAVMESGSDVVVLEASARYFGSARFDDEVEIAMSYEKLGKTSTVSRFDATRDGERLVEGRLVHVFVDPATMAKQAIPEWIRERLAPYVTPAPPRTP
jgi:acyl-CoA thioester hydrolase